ncbi:hypothetical protein GXSOP10_1074 [Armatimonadetes bacterium GXS]|jgi:hypothetical protein|nr:hypothetical protein GXSOP10_1074 [Armatimonadetes bacterium GXS]
MPEERVVIADARIHLFEGAQKLARLPRRKVWTWPARFALCEDPEVSWTMFILPLEPLEACRWTQCKVSVLFEEAERFLVPGSRFTFTFQTMVRPPEVIGEGIVERSYRVARG